MSASLPRSTVAVFAAGFDAAGEGCPGLDSVIAPLVAPAAARTTAAAIAHLLRLKA
jgi:hypothetical protein